MLSPADIQAFDLKVQAADHLIIIHFEINLLLLFPNNPLKITLK